MSGEMMSVTKTLSDNGFMIEAEIPRNIGVCAKTIDIEVDTNGKIVDLVVIGGCAGNLEAVAKLIKGKDIKEVIDTLKGITCGRKNTSCPDVIAKILEIYA